ncbi:PKD domain-containing protein [Zobellia uliginosa]|uniref:PKD domain-containing protein n=1 Tax=Zobellia uliginosa TaxID=143224 RepID=UPI001C070D05|nr:cadherin repeat domain-containing protein [Zobellia uliginosa]
MAPVARAGLDQVITLPTSTVTLDGSGSSDTAPGTIDTYAWTQVNGPATANIVSPSNENTSVNGLIQGIYTFELTVTDNGSPALSDTATITVNVNNPVPTAVFSGPRNVSSPSQLSVNGTVTISNGPMTFTFGMSAFMRSGSITFTIDGTPYSLTVPASESDNKLVPRIFTPGTYNYTLTLSGSGTYNGGVSAQQL